MKAATVTLPPGMHVDRVTLNGEAPASPAFDALERQARELEAPDQAGAGVPGQPGQAPAIDTTAAELMSALELARLMCKPMFKWWPEFADTWSDQTLKDIAAGGAQVMLKHGWTFGGLMSEFAPYIALGTATVPPVMLTLSAIKARKAELANQASAPPAPIVASGADDPTNQ